MIRFGHLHHVKEDLINKKKVLFTGTPCQIVGLKLFLGKRSTDDNLLLCEILCHGVPSPLIWKEYLNFVQLKTKSNIIDYKNPIL